MNIGTILKIEGLKAENKTFYYIFGFIVFLILLATFALYKIKVSLAGQSGVGTELTIDSLFKMLSVKLAGYFKFLALMFMILSVSREWSANVIKKHIIDGFSRYDYLTGKLLIIPFLSTTLVFLVFSPALLLAVFSPVFSILEFFNGFTPDMILRPFLGFIIYGMIGLSFVLIFKKALVSILLYLGVAIIETIIDIADRLLWQINIKPLLPLEVFGSVITGGPLTGWEFALFPAYFVVFCIPGLLYFLKAKI